MNNIIDRQTFIISINCLNFATVGPIETKSQIQLPMNLRFAADELILKSINYNVPVNTDISDIVQIWCNITNDGLIGSFPNDIAVYQQHNEHFTISNSFQTGNFIIQLQNTSLGDPASYNPQSLISSTAQHTFGILVLTIEFVKHSK